MPRVLFLPSHLNNELDRELADSFSTQTTNPDVVLVSGGDGSMLHAIRRCSGSPIFYGVANGTRNFLMNNVPLSHIKGKGFLKDPVIKTPVFRVEIFRRDLSDSEVKVLSLTAVNDVVVAGDIMDYHEYFLMTPGMNSSVSFKGMGILISTPLGSTGMWSNANRQTEAIPLDEKIAGVISMFSERPILEYVSLEKEKISISVTPRRGSAYLYIDGKGEIVSLHQGDRIEISMKELVFIGFRDIDQFILKRTPKDFLLPEEIEAYQDKIIKMEKNSPNPGCPNRERFRQSLKPQNIQED